jgi:hypothetical protein
MKQPFTTLNFFLLGDILSHHSPSFSPVDEAQPLLLSFFSVKNFK